MSGAVPHFIGPAENDKHILSFLSSKRIPAKFSRDSRSSHIFVEKSALPSLLEAFSISAISNWTRCEGCSRCRQRKRKSDGQRYTLYPPLILLPTGSSLDVCKANAASLLEKFPDCTHVAMNNPIKAGDPVRRPQIEPILGNFGQFEETNDPSHESFNNAFWASSTQNGIYQTWAPMYTMFSRGNVTEKQRVLTTFNSQSPIEGSTVIDLYAGIGYFTLPYTKQNPKVVYCWEINPWSIEGLLRAAKRNKFQARLVRRNERYVPDERDQIIVFAENNEHALGRLEQLNLARLSHINMGLLPNAHDAIPVALKLCEAASETDLTMIHLHENIKSDSCESWKQDHSRTLGRCRHLEKIKQYSPGVIHVCGDFEHIKRPSHASAVSQQK